jgi:hypothetical protein
MRQMTGEPGFTYEWKSAPSGEVWDAWVWFTRQPLFKSDDLVRLAEMSQSAHDEDALQRVVEAFAAPYCRARIKITSDFLLENIEQRCMADAGSA